VQGFRACEEDLELENIRMNLKIQGDSDMEAMEAILGRRSIRKYTAQAVSEDMIGSLLEAGMSAPSAGNEQPWHFVIIDDRRILDAIPSIHPHSHMLKEAPLAILVCGDLNLDVHRGFWTQDCSAATENILIAAHANGLGAVWLGIYPREERIAGVRQILSIPDHIIPFCLIAVGHPAEKKAGSNRYDESRIHLNGW
jgi:nitroreductase